jgi:hypothetical protein
MPPDQNSAGASNVNHGVRKFAHLHMEMSVFKKLVPLVGLMVLAGPVLALAATSPTGSSTATSSTAQTKKTHKHTHHKKATKPTQT